MGRYLSEEYDGGGSGGSVCAGGCGAFLAGSGGGVGLEELMAGGGVCEERCWSEIIRRRCEPGRLLN